ncbi:MAG: hypothetical protein GY913_35385 [Proteobacteria bacterium]|nr:hypothetical protein [Pseudomonadota bacterium]MCP4922215.1 hypothetical protein [Pseudomonadota bacterium]
MLLLLLSCGPKKLSTPGDVFPIVEGARYHYVATFNGMEFQETRVVVPIELGDGSAAWGFVEEEEIGDDVVSLFTGHFGLGVYRSTGSMVETADAFWGDDAEHLSASSWQPMLSLPPEPGASITLDTDSPDRGGAITVLEYGDITVPAGTFTACAHIDLGQKGSSAWLCPGIGLVKWTLVTGRVEELASYSF